ncbi:LLM class flavin-dependent oxidoreductase [Actinomadura rubrisoli]|uniref:LLM class flavin-dependent oxidoreductase n=1 Tax=Actinomadura rubrisoli TaxID=2530368 RepID=A0A4R5AD49_9ACTN|nr:LLM class flavin-dependent oxidoreductase [Actinomadura rubrisoli]
MEISCAFATSLDSHEHARIAEGLGYERAWFFDSPALYPDVWMQLCRAGERTDRIGLGPGVVVPALRHPMVTAAAIATLVSLVGPERVAVGVGSGFSGRLALGRRPIPWSQVADYIRVVKALLRGERADWDGAVIEMLHQAGFAPSRPIEVPFLVGAQGPKGVAVAGEVGDGVFSGPVAVPGFGWSAVMTYGTVLEDGEDPGSERALAAAGHAAGMVGHFAVEFGQLDLVPSGRDWAAAYDAVPREHRHLAMHEGHLVAINSYDRPFVTGDLLEALGMALGPAGWREKLALLEQGGATEVVYQPAGPDIPRELETFAAAARG